MIYDEEQQAIRTVLRDSRIEALAIFMSDFVGLLHQEGFSFQDLLEGLAKWAYEHKTSPDSVVKHLEDAALELHKRKKDDVQINC